MFILYNFLNRNVAENILEGYKKQNDGMFNNYLHNSVTSMKF